MKASTTADDVEQLHIRMEFLRSKHDTAGSLDLMRMTIPPAGQMPVAHYHRNWDETVYGLEGTITFTVDGAEHAVGPGDTLFIKRGIMHGPGGLRIGSEPGRAVLSGLGGFLLEV